MSAPKYIQTLLLPYLLVWGMVLCFSLPGLSQGQDSLALDDYEMTYRPLDSAQLAAFAADPDFDYTETPPKLSFFLRFMRWLQRNLDQEGKKSQTVAKFIGYGLAILFVGLLVFQFLKVPIQGLWSRRVSALEDPMQAGLGEEIMEWNFDERIAAAEAEGDFRKALRLLFLESLKILASHDLIEWKVNNTNREYEKELRGTPYELVFRKLRQTFEYVWYGDFTLEEETYREMAQIFKDFRTTIETRSRT